MHNGLKSVGNIQRQSLICLEKYQQTALRLLERKTFDCEKPILHSTIYYYRANNGHSIIVPETIVEWCEYAMRNLQTSICIAIQLHIQERT